MANRPPAQSSLDRTAFEMLRLLSRTPSACPVCGVAGESITKYIDVLFYERANDIATREAIRRAGGFCRHHARMVSRQADALGSALILGDVLVNQLRALDAGTFSRPPRTAGRWSRFLDGAAADSRPACPLCVEQRAMEEGAVDSLLSGLASEEFAQALRSSAGLCLPHFQMGFERCHDEAAWLIVLEVEKEALAGLVGELGELARKSDYRFQDEKRGAESDSWRRALDMSSGRVHQ